MPNHAPFLGVLNPLILWVVIQTPKKAQPWVTTRHLSHKWLNFVQGFDQGGVARKKVYPGQDRTGQDNNKVTKA